MKFSTHIQVVSFFAVILSGAALAQDDSTDTAVDDGVEDAVLDAQEALSTPPAAEAPKEEKVAADAPPAAAETAPKEEAAENAELEKASKEEAAEEQKPAEETKPEANKAAESPAEEKVEEEEKPTTSLNVDSSYNDPRMFGKWRLQLAMNRPKFNEGQKYYNKLYSSESDYFTIGVDYFPFDFFLTAGFTVRAGVYSDTGHAARLKNGASRETATDDDVEIDSSSQTNLLLAPVQVLFKVQATPFRKKWVVLDGWVGIENTYWREVRVVEQNETASTTTSSSTETTTSKNYVNRGTKQAMTVGGSVNILLNPLDERSVRSMEGVMGIGSIYLSPYVEVVRSLQQEGARFGRSVIGIGFTFESAR